MINTKTHNKFKFTKTKIENLPSPKSGRKYYKDTEEHGLQLYVTPNGVKTFCFRKKILGRDHILTFGKHGEITVDIARKKCLKAKSEISENDDFFERKNVNYELQSFSESVDEYIKLHCETHKRMKQVKAEKKYLELYLSKLSHRKLKSITKEDIILLHKNITNNNGSYIANRVIAFIRAMFNWKIENQQWKEHNPASKVRLNKEVKKDRFLRKDERKKFIKSLDQELNEIARDFFYLAILTGARRNNVLAMKWVEIDFENKTWRIPKTKNHDAHNVPLLDEVIILLENRNKRNLELGFKDSPFVLPSNMSKTGHFAEPKSAWARILKRAGIEDLTMHDLRRTMGSYMTMQGTNIQTVGKVLGHKNSASTLIYSRLDMDTARRAMENAASEILN